MNPTLEKFYLAILEYAGLKYENGVILNKNEDFEFTIDGKHLTLPYLDNLKNPGDRIIFHPLNENYVQPETVVFKHFKKKLVGEINIRLYMLFVTMIDIVTDNKKIMQVTNNDLLRRLELLGDCDVSVVDQLLKIANAGRKLHNASFFLDIFLKKNGAIKDVHYAAIAKVNFRLYKEIQEALKTKEYKVFKVKVRKKDILALDGLFSAVFNDPDNGISIDDEDSYSTGTDNKVFRYFEALLRGAYMVTSMMNNITEAIMEIDECKKEAEELLFDHSWVDMLEQVADMAKEIRMIPNQTDIQLEAKERKSNKLQANTKRELEEDQVTHMNQGQQRNLALPDAPVQQPTQQPVQGNQQQSSQPDPLQVLKQRSTMPQMPPGMPQMPQMGYPGPMAPVNPYVPPQAPQQPPVTTQQGAVDPLSVLRQQQAQGGYYPPQQFMPQQTTPTWGQPPLPGQPIYPPQAGYPQQTMSNQPAMWGNQLQMNTVPQSNLQLNPAFLMR